MEMRACETVSCGHSLKRLAHYQPGKIAASISNDLLTVAMGKDAECAARARRIAIGKACSLAVLFWRKQS